MITYAFRYRYLSPTKALFLFLFVCAGIADARANTNNLRNSDHLFNYSISGVQSSDSLQIIFNKDVLVLGKYGGNKRKLVKKGTLLKVYSIPVMTDKSTVAKGRAFQPKKQVFKGNFDSVIGDTLIIIRQGKVLKFDIDDLFQIKVYNEIGARVFGDMINLVGIYGMTAGGYVAGIGAVWSFQGNGVDGLGFLIVGFGAMVGGLGYLVHRLGLIVRRNKYDLIDDWYIVREIE